MRDGRSSEYRDEGTGWRGGARAGAGVSSLPRPGVAGAAEPGGGRLVPGQVIGGRFCVVRLIAAGGMGAVYEVEDRYLQGHHVALKVILPDVAQQAGSLVRFEREVLLARKVTHANLCPIYDIDRFETTGSPVLFLTMKLLAGETLLARLRRSPRISAVEAEAIFRQMVAGIGAIHAEGIIHRDIKPNNVMLEGTGAEVCVRIMDFGLAWLHENEMTMATRSLMAGTPGYMAPETFLGRGPSQAMDIFALGIMMHEVLTGERPLATSAIKAPEPSRSLYGAEIAPLLREAVIGFLAEKPQRRVEAFRQVEIAFTGGTAEGRAGSKLGVWGLRPGVARGGVAGLLGMLVLGGTLSLAEVRDRVRGMLFSSREKHVAVLPLSSSGGSAETQALGDGLMDSLAGKLSNLDVVNDALWVVPASDVRRRKVDDAAAAMREFGATIVVKGKFERTDAGMRLELVLIDPKKGRQTGFVDVRTQNGDLVGLQDEAVARLGRLMNLRLRGGEPARAVQGPANRAAYEDYLEGDGYYERKDKPGNVDRAIASLSRAVQTDPRFALGYARLTEAYVLQYKLSGDRQWIARAETTGREAAELDSKVAATYVALAHLHLVTGKNDLAIQEFQRALQLNPRDAEALGGMAHTYEAQGQTREAADAFVRAAALRPGDWKGYNELGIFYDDAGRAKDAITAFRRALELTPDNTWPLINLGMAYIDLDDPKHFGEAESALRRSIAIDPTFAAYGDMGLLYSEEHRYKESVEASEKSIALDHESSESWTYLALALDWMGRSREAEAARKENIAVCLRELQVNSQDAVTQATLAALYAHSGLRDQAMRQIQIALALAPANQYVLAHIAEAYELLGNRREAVKYLEQAMGQGYSRGRVSNDPELATVLQDASFHLP